MSGGGFGFGFGTAVSLAVVGVLCGGLYGCPEYNVYTAKMSGQATLAEADSSKQVAVQTAKAKLEAASMLADAEVARARGVAQANKIISDQLGGPEFYLRWKYIEMLEDTAASPGKTIIYVPTNGLMPVMEAGRSKE